MKYSTHRYDYVRDIVRRYCTTNQWLFPKAQQPLVSQDLLIIETSRSHSDTHALGWIPLDKWLARCRYLYLTAHNTPNRQISMPLTGFEATIPAIQRQQTHAFDREAIGIGTKQW